METTITFLDVDLSIEQKKLKELSYWLNVLNRPNGWHYDLDHIYILNELEKNKILPGSTIIDAGAGQGIMQYVLASRGYNVISLDFSPRNKPFRANGIFSIAGSGIDNINYDHDYMNFIHYGDSSPRSMISRLNLKKLNKIVFIPGRIYRKIKSLSFYLWARYFTNKNNFGKITYLRAPFHKIKLPDNTADAIVSVSAIEHADINLFSENIKELTRVLKNNAELIITTSGSVTDNRTYDKKVEGWNYCETDFKELLPNSKINFMNKHNFINNLLSSRTFMSRIDPYYYEDEESIFYKKMFKTLPYLPIVIKITK
jgi:ubiquinone/menaquinone biosynthesis C-methylase UbiE